MIFQKIVYAKTYDAMKNPPSKILPPKVSPQKLHPRKIPPPIVSPLYKKNKCFSCMGTIKEYAPSDSNWVHLFNWVKVESSPDLQLWKDKGVTSSTG